MPTNNRIVLDLGKCSYAKFYYQNQYEQRLELLPKHPTYLGDKIDGNRYSTGESLLEYATKNNLMDRWTPHIRFQLSNSHSVTYTGQKAVAMNREWRQRIFKKKGKTQ